MCILIVQSLQTLSFEYIYNRMFDCKPIQTQEDEFDESVLRKAWLGNNSGYLDEEYELTRNFPVISEYHFRIEDESEILNLEKLRRQSAPIAIQATFNNSSQGFKQRLGQLLDGLDARKVSFDNTMEQEKHGFYTLADHYDDQGVISSMLEKARIEELRVQMQEVSIKDIKPVFIKKPKSKLIEPIPNQDQEIHKLSKKFNRITISQENF